MPKGAIWLLVLLLIGVAGWEIIYKDSPIKKIAGFGVELELDTTNNSPPAKAQLVHQNLLVSDYHTMYINIEHPFGASIALDDSIFEAQKELPTGINFTNDGIKVTYGGPNITIVSTNETMSVGTKVDLTGSTNAFLIKHATNEDREAQEIPTNNPKHNFAVWRWLVTPLEKGPQTLYIEAYTVDERGHRKPINSTKKEIDVITISRPSGAENASYEAKREYVTEFEQAPAVKTNVSEETALLPPGVEAVAEEVEETPAVAEANTAAEEAVYEAAAANETAEAAEKAAPGFESIFAITCLMAVTYLVLSRKN